MIINIIYKGAYFTQFRQFSLVIIIYSNVKLWMNPKETQVSGSDGKFSHFDFSRDSYKISAGKTHVNLTN